MLYGLKCLHVPFHDEAQAFTLFYLNVLGYWLDHYLTLTTNISCNLNAWGKLDISFECQQSLQVSFSVCQVGSGALADAVIG